MVRIGQKVRVAGQEESTTENMTKGPVTPVLWYSKVDGVAEDGALPACDT
jgi:hypothetical protein